VRTETQQDVIDLKKTNFYLLWHSSKYVLENKTVDTLSYCTIYDIVLLCYAFLYIS